MNHSLLNTGYLYFPLIFLIFTFGFTFRKVTRTHESPFSTCYFSLLHGVRTAFPLG